MRAATDDSAFVCSPARNRGGWTALLLNMKQHVREHGQIFWKNLVLDSGQGPVEMKDFMLGGVATILVWWQAYGVRGRVACVDSKT